MSSHLQVNLLSVMHLLCFGSGYEAELQVRPAPLPCEDEDGRIKLVDEGGSASRHNHPHVHKRCTEVVCFPAMHSTAEWINFTSQASRRGTPGALQDKLAGVHAVWCSRHVHLREQARCRIHDGRKCSAAVPSDFESADLCVFTQFFLALANYHSAEISALS